MLIWIFGNVTHSTVKHYDVILMSNAIIPEVANITHMFKNSGIPLTIEERDKEDIPLVVFGGAASSEANIILGPMYNDDGTYVGKSLIDIANYGYGEENVTALINRLYDYKTSGGNTHDKPVIKETLINEEFLKEYLFYPEHYEWVYDEKDHWTIKEIKCLDSRLPKRVKYNTIHKDFRGFPLRVMHLSGQAAHAQDIMISSGCSGQSSTCSFCLEATLAGRYFERELSDVEDEIKYARKTTAPNAISPYSFNLNYYKHFMDLISLIGHNSKTISMHNERVDVVANAPDQMLLAKKMGLMRFAGAIEGCSDRIRNGLLNKNLSEETLLRAFDIIFDLKLMHAKCLTPDARVFTDKGIRQIGDLSVGDRVWSGSKFVEVRDFYVNPETDILKVKLHSGAVIKGRPDHKVKTERGWVELNQLTLNDRIMVNSSSVDYEVPYKSLPVDKSHSNWKTANLKQDEILLDESLGAIIGWISGDGHLRKDRSGVSLVANYNEEEIIEGLCEYIHTLGIPTQRYDRDTGCFVTDFSSWEFRSVINQCFDGRILGRTR